jgi:hypothetical protein
VIHCDAKKAVETDETIVLKLSVKVSSESKNFWFQDECRIGSGSFSESDLPERKLLGRRQELRPGDERRRSGQVLLGQTDQTGTAGAVRRSVFGKLKFCRL